ncbi:hypothetical protein E2C01_057143 [Portunus trituberculatus]|uniref:Uncharacterized protein n=1 Tax=Portunus trituberculatus TaxID=210409 RepID=A0A5B7GS77_PORTR|nr:hypothetical protein [Portunus trituberculatus]
MAAFPAVSVGCGSSVLRAFVVTKVEAEFHRRISEVQAEFRVRISDLQAEFSRRIPALEGRSGPTVTLPSKAMQRGVTRRKVLMAPHLLETRNPFSVLEGMAEEVDVARGDEERKEWRTQFPCPKVQY